MTTHRIETTDCLSALREMPSDSIDSIVTDPPYGLAFMGKRWDYDVPSVEIWEECLRVLKPGGYLLAFAGTRTQHRMAVRIEDAGFEIRDMIAWVYGSGFPKSLDVSKAIDKSTPATPEAQQWQGWGTALKPALEPITVARKPLIGTVAANVLRHGTGGINVDGCRVGMRDERPLNRNASIGFGGSEPMGAVMDGGCGRWPANLIHDGSPEVVGLFPVTGASKAAHRGLRHSSRHGGLADMGSNIKQGTDTIRGHNDNGGSAARFFYCAKASKADRNAGCDALPERAAAECVEREEDSAGMASPGAGAGGRTGARNHHPTVKPTDLMRYLCRLVTPPGGTVLDPFCGSGSTGRGAVLEGFGFVGFEMDEDYATIARARVADAATEAKATTSDTQPAEQLELF